MIELELDQKTIEQFKIPQNKERFARLNEDQDIERNNTKDLDMHRKENIQLSEMIESIQGTGRSKENGQHVPLLKRKGEVLRFVANVIAHPFSSMSSEKVRFIHYPQIYLLPTVPLAIAAPFLNKEIAVIYTTIYAASLLVSIIESKIHKKNAINLKGNLEAMFIKNPKKKEFLDGNVIEERDDVVELHWVPGKREKVDNKKLLILKTSQQFIESLLDLRERFISNDPQFEDINSVRMTSALIQDSLEIFRGETTPITNNKFLRLLDHIGTRVNLIMNLNFRAAFLEPVKTSKTAWLTKDKLISEETETFLNDKLNRISRLVNKLEQRQN